jgi:hypothetical protein
MWANQRFRWQSNPGNPKWAPVAYKDVDILERHCNDKSITQFLVCTACKQSLSGLEWLPLSETSCFAYPPKQELRPLNPVSELLISPRLPFMHFRVSPQNNRRGTENAGVGVAVYRNLQVQPLGHHRHCIWCTNGVLGDNCLIEVTVEPRMKFVPIAVHVHPGTSHEIFISSSFILWYHT